MRSLGKLDRTSQSPLPIGQTTESFDRAAALAALRQSIAGREQEPAGKVFENTKVLDQFPAGKLLAIMDVGFSRSLGVECTHCHDPGRWSSEEKEPFRIAREMWNLAKETNARLGAITLLQDRKPPPTVNCTTCHRGNKKPALQLDPPPQ